MTVPEPVPPSLHAAGHPTPRPAAPQLLRYAVIYSGDCWRVLSARAQIGRFHTRGEAMAVAVKLTRQALEAGQIAELYAQDELGDFALYPLFPPTKRR